MQPAVNAFAARQEDDVVWERIHSARALGQLGSKVKMRMARPLGRCDFLITDNLTIPFIQLMSMAFR